jgi:peptidoglycan/LPS O-acetylase OafA/YrhL
VIAANLAELQKAHSIADRVTPLVENRLPDNSRLWIASALVVFLVLVSWMKNLIISSGIDHIPGVTYPFDEYIYIALRLVVIGVLIWLFLHFRLTTGTGDPKKVALTNDRWFDPLMGLRAFACFLVLLGHYYMVTYAPSSISEIEHPLKKAFLILLSGSPWGGVWVFFTLSGYLMGKGFVRGRYSLDEPGVALYVRNRMLRIVPIYFMANFLLSVWICPGIFEWKNIWMLIEILTFDYRGNLGINPDGALWSVSTEVQFYFLVPLIVVCLYMLKKKAPWIVTTIPLWLLTLGTVWRMSLLHLFPDFSRYYAWGYAPLVSNLDLFITGLSLNLIPKPAGWLLNLSDRRRGALLIGLTGVFYIVISILSTLHVRYSALNERMFQFWTIAPVLACAFASSFIYIAELKGRMKISKGMIGRLLLGIQGLGTITYCAYVFHPGCYESLRRILPDHLSLSLSIAFMPVAMIIVLLMALIFNRLIEEPFEARKRISA